MSAETAVMEMNDSCNGSERAGQKSYPSCSVIIPVYNASATLERCLESLRRLRYPAEKLEIIVVDNGSTDDSVRIARRFQVTLLHETAVRTSYAARNRGIVAARGELIAFTDADCIVTPGWLERLVAGWEDARIGCFAGEIEAHEPEELIEAFSDRAGILRQKGTLDCPYLPYTQTANSSYRREVFEKVGLFDPQMSSGGDADIAWRMQKQLGLTIRFVPDALVYHKHRTSLQGLYDQFHKYEKGKVQWLRHYTDYQLPPMEQRRRELAHCASQVTARLSADTEDFLGERIDLVDLLSPFLRFVMSLGTCKARLDAGSAEDPAAVLQQDPAEACDKAAVPLTEERERDGGREKDLAASLAALEAQLREKERQIEALLSASSESITQRDQRICELLNSLSWRITRPLRTIYEALLKSKLLRTPSHF